MEECYGLCSPSTGHRQAIGKGDIGGLGHGPPIPPRQPPTSCMLHAARARRLHAPARAIHLDDDDALQAELKY